MKKLYIILFISLPLLIFSQPDSLYNIFNKANQFYQAKQYHQAINLYEEILSTGYVAPEVYYNLGNAYYRTGNLPKAILYYEKAYLLKPTDKDIKSNLAYIKNLLKLPKNDWSFYDKIVLLLDADTWAYVSLATFVLFLFFVFLVMFSNKLGIRRLSFYSAIVLIIISLSTFIFSLSAKSILQDSKHAVIMQPVTAKSEPSEQGNEIYVINPGTIVRILKYQKDWVEIELHDGSIGWVKKNKLEKI